MRHFDFEACGKTHDAVRVVEVLVGKRNAVRRVLLGVNGGSSGHNDRKSDAGHVVQRLGGGYRGRGGGGRG